MKHRVTVVVSETERKVLKLVLALKNESFAQWFRAKMRDDYEALKGELNDLDSTVSQHRAKESETDNGSNGSQLRGLQGISQAHGDKGNSGQSKRDLPYPPEPLSLGDTRRHPNPGKAGSKEKEGRLEG